MSDMSKESAPSGGDPLDIVPDLTEGDDAAPGDEAGLSDETESSPAAGSRTGDVRLGQRVRPDAGHRRDQPT